MSKTEELKDSNRRWTILRVLAGDKDHEVESRSIQIAVADAVRVHNVGLDTIRRDILWLERKLLVTVEVEEDYIFAKLTQRGMDVAMERVEVDGIDDNPLE